MFVQPICKACRLPFCAYSQVDWLNAFNKTWLVAYNPLSEREGLEVKSIS